MSLRIVAALAFIGIQAAAARSPVPLGREVSWPIKLPPGAVATNHLPEDGRVVALAASAPFLLIANHDKENWEIRDWSRNKIVARLRSKDMPHDRHEELPPTRCHLCGMSEDGRNLLFKYRFGLLVAWDWAKKTVKTVAALPNGAAETGEYWDTLLNTSPLTFAVRKEAGRIEFYDAKTRKRLHRPFKIPLKKSVFSIRLSPGRRFAEIGLSPEVDAINAKNSDDDDPTEDPVLHYIDLRTGKEHGPLEGPPSSDFIETHWTPDSRFLATGGFDSVEEERIGALHEFASGKRLLPATAKAMSAAINEDGRIGAVLTSYRTVEMWDMTRMKRIHRFTTSRGLINRMQFLMGGRYLATIGRHPGGQFDFDPAKHGIDLIVWEISTVRFKVPAMPPVTDAPKLWAALAKNDIKAARSAVWQLASSPKTALPLLAKRVKPSPRPDKDAKPLAKNAERLRAWRAIEILERIGGDEAMRLLRRLEGGGDPGEAGEARAALIRLDQARRRSALRVPRLER